MVVFVKSCCNLAKVVVIEKKWLQSGKKGCNRAKWFYSNKLVVFGQKWLYLDKKGSTRAIRLYSAKVVVFGQKWFYSR